MTYKWCETFVHHNKLCQFYTGADMYPQPKPIPPEMYFTLEFFFFFIIYEYPVVLHDTLKRKFEKHIFFPARVLPYT